MGGKGGKKLKKLNVSLSPLKIALIVGIIVLILLIIFILLLIFVLSKQTISECTGSTGGQPIEKPLELPSATLELKSDKFNYKEYCEQHCKTSYRTQELAQKLSRKSKYKKARLPRKVNRTRSKRADEFQDEENTELEPEESTTVNYRKHLKGKEQRSDLTELESEEITTMNTKKKNHSKEKTIDFKELEPEGITTVKAKKKVQRIEKNTDHSELISEDITTAKTKKKVQGIGKNTDFTEMEPEEVTAIQTKKVQGVVKTTIPKEYTEIKELDNKRKLINVSNVRKTERRIQKKANTTRNVTSSTISCVDIENPPIFPHVAALLEEIYVDDKAELRFVCPVAILTYKILLASGKCIPNMNDEYDYAKGLYVRAASSSWSAGGTFHPVQSIQHPDYPDSYYPTIVAIRLKIPLPRFNHIIPCKISTKSQFKSMKIASSYDWPETDAVPLKRRKKNGSLERKFLAIYRDADCLQGPYKSTQNIFCGYEFKTGTKCYHKLGSPLFADGFLIGFGVDRTCFGQNNVTVYYYEDVVRHKRWLRNLIAGSRRNDS